MNKAVWNTVNILIETPGKVQKILIPRSDVMDLLQHIQDLEQQVKEVATHAKPEQLSRGEESPVGEQAYSFLDDDR